MPRESHSDRCINPCKDEGVPNHVGSNLRKISKSLLQKYPHLPENSKVCNNCRLGRSLSGASSSSINTSRGSICDMVCNESLSTSNNSNSSFINESQSSLTRLHDLEELLQGLKDKFASLEANDPMKVRILTIAPESWGIKKISREFDTSAYLAKKAKELRSNGGVLAEVTPRVGKTLPDSTITKIVEFFNDDSISRIIPGVKDTVSVKVGNKRIKVQKRLLLMSLKELHTSFRESYQNLSVSFSAFAKLRPKHCILPGASGTHSVCVCTIHQNCKLMLDSINVEALTKDSDNPICNYKDCLDLILCKPPTSACYLDECKQCPDITHFSEILTEALRIADIDQVQYTTWTGTDRSTLHTVIADIDDFVDELCYKLQILKPHSFIAKQQSQFISQKKFDLRNGEVIVMFDFSENYSYTAQDASQAFHFNNDQCTVFPTIYYYKEGSELKLKSLVFLSDSVKHDTAAVYTIQKKLVPEIKKNVKNVRKLIYMTDGAKQHFKNRFQIANLLNHKEDFGLDAEWHYCATAHGKSGYDGIGATFKREAYRASLIAKPSEAILKPEVLFKWAQNHFKKIKIFYFSKVDHNKTTRHLSKRFQSASYVPDISINHSFTPLTPKKLLIKRFSNANHGVEFSLKNTK